MRPGRCVRRAGVQLVWLVAVWPVMLVRSYREIKERGQ